MSHLLRSFLSLAVLLAMLYLPLRAAEEPPPQETETPVEEEAGESPPPSPPRRGGNEEDRLSLDNNLSFPVDI
jgi:hypothetical protein